MKLCYNIIYVYASIDIYEYNIGVLYITKARMRIDIVAEYRS